MRFFPDDPSRVTTVQWYWTRSIKSLPFPTAFYRRQWEHGEDNQEPIGEIFGTEKWHGAHPPYAIGYGPPCGDAELWLKGAPSSAPIPDRWPNTLVPKCCPQPPPDPVGGVAVGGIAGPCCAGQNTAAVNFTWSSVTCIPGGVGSVPLLPFTGDCSYDPSFFTAVVYHTGPIMFLGLLTDVLFVCDLSLPGYAGITWLFANDPANPCKSVSPGEQTLIPMDNITCNPLKCEIQSAYQFIQYGPCRGQVVLLGIA